MYAPSVAHTHVNRRSAIISQPQCRRIIQISSRIAFHYLGRVCTKSVIWKLSNILVDEPVWIKKVERSFNNDYGRCREARNDTGLTKSRPSSCKFNFLKTRKIEREWISGVE